MDLPISASIGNECVKGPCQDTIAALWACNVRPSIGTHGTIAALEGENITTMLISGHSLSILQTERGDGGGWGYMDGHHQTRSVLTYLTFNKDPIVSTTCL